MSAYFTPVNYGYSLQPELDPRTKYLNALQQVRAAEAEYLEAEAIQREEEALRQRLQEIQLRKRHSQFTPAYNADLRTKFAPAYNSEDNQRAMAIEAAKRLLAEEETKTRQRRAQEEELEALTRRIEQQRHERLLAERRIKEAQRRPAPSVNTHATVAELLSAIVNQANASASVSKKTAEAPTVNVVRACRCEPAPSKAPEQAKPKKVQFQVQVQEPAKPQPRPKSTATSLKEQLEARLYSDESTEIRDTIQAIFASLADAKPTAESTAGPAQPSSSSKGKGKASPTTEPEPTSRDVANAFDVVRNIETAFTSLESEFVFPPKLDLDSGSSTTSKLAFTANNHPIKYYEQSLTGLLLQLDQIDSFGNEELRSMRKEIVGRVEKALEDLESEVEGRWKAKERKENRASGEVSPVAEREQTLPEQAPVAEPVVEPEQSSVGEPVAQPEQTPVEEPVVEPEQSLVGEPVAQPEQAPVEEPVVEPEQTQIGEPAAQPEQTVVEELVVVETPVSVEQEQPEPETIIEPTTSSYPPAPVSERVSEPSISSYPPVSQSSYPPAVPYDIEPNEPTSTDDESESELDTFLQPAVREEETSAKRKALQSSDGDSDWSEVDA